MMNRARKELAVWERNNRRVDSYISYYFFLIYSIAIAVTLGFDVDTQKWNIGIIANYFFICFNTVYIYEKSLIKIKEKEKNRNIFYKYIYVPISLKDLYWAKMYVIGIDIMKIVLIEQGLAVLTRCIDGGDFSYMGLMLMPFYVGIVLILYFGVILRWNCRRCMKEC